MAKKNLPNIPIYIGDWERDCNVLSLESEAAWMRIVFKLWTKGKQNVIKIPTKSLQNLWRCSSEKMNEILDDLIYNDIADIEVSERFIEFSCRRFVKENNLSEIRSQASKSKQTLNKPKAKEQQNTDNDYDNENENESNNENENKKEKIDFQKIVDIFNSVSKDIPKVKNVTQSRKRSIKARVKEHGLSEVVEVFHKVQQSEFLTGNNERGWRADFDWIMKPNNFVKILEGQYQNKTKSTKQKKVNAGILLQQKYGLS